jgi:hypothetical protein
MTALRNLLVFFAILRTRLLSGRLLAEQTGTWAVRPAISPFVLSWSMLTMVIRGTNPCHSWSRFQDKSGGEGESE